MSDLVVLRFGVDTLESHIAGELPLSVRGDLEKGKADAMAADAAVPYPLAGVDFFIQPKGLRYHPYLIENELMSLRVTHSLQMPMVSLRLSAYGLALMGHEELYQLALKAAAELGAIYPQKLSRIDLAADFQGFEPTREEMDAMRCRMRYRAYHENGEGRTFQYGKGQLVVRVYNKTAQAREKDLGWVEEMHRACPGYRSELPAYRAEVQLRRQALKELGVDSVERAFAVLPSLFQFGMTEVELRVPQTDSTITRWPVDDRWARIRDVDDTARPLKRFRRSPVMLHQYAAAKRCLNAAAIFGAYIDDCDDLFSLAPRLVNRMLDIVDEEDIDFAGLMEAHRRRLGCSRIEEEPF